MDCVMKVSADVPAGRQTGAGLCVLAADLPLACQHGPVLLSSVLSCALLSLQLPRICCYAQTASSNNDQCLSGIFHCLEL